MLISRRVGITILEVLIAMGIAVFGLFAVLALIPFASFRATQGLNFDEGAALAERAFSEFKNRHMHDPSNWRVAAFDTSSNTWVPIQYNLHAFYADEQAPYASTQSADPNAHFFADEAILIDPMFGIARSHGQNDGSEIVNPIVFPSVAPPVISFPYTNKPGAFLDSETNLFAQFASPFINGTAPSIYSQFDDIAPNVRRATIVNAANGRPIDPILASEFAETLDDLDFHMPAGEDGQRLSRLSFVSNDPAAASDEQRIPNSKKNSLGRISWVAMLVPQNLERTTWKCYIIVMKDRDPLFATSSPLNERAARIRGTLNYPAAHGFASNGTKGGAVRIESWGTAGLATSPLQVGSPAYITMQKDVAVPRGGWVLLTQFRGKIDADANNAWGPTDKYERKYEWYQVAEASSFSQSVPDNVLLGGNQVVSRNLVLHGPDWDPRFETLVYWFNETITVYERTIELPTGIFAAPTELN